MALPQFAENPSMAKAERVAQDLLQRAQALPITFWRQLLVAFALVWAVHSVASLFWVLVPSPDVATPRKVAVVPAVKSTSSNKGYAVDLAALKKRQLFGDSSGVVDSAQDTPAVTNINADVAKTNLNLTLAGVLVVSPEKFSTAVIASGSEQNVYKINDRIPSGTNVTLVKVLSDRVILSNNGKHEALWLYSEADFKKNVAARRSSGRRSTASKTDGTVKRKIAANRVPKSINDVMRMSVYREEGKMMGYRIRPGRDRELFDELGLKANDIVTSVNGVTMDDPAQIRKNYQALKKATEADLEILRNGEVVSINISLDTGE